MTLRLPEHWVWDFWTAQEEDRVHVFFLYAPRSLEDPELRHYAARIGHAVSDDLRTWVVLPEALAPSEEPRFDDRAVWTGSVVRHGDEWLMFYTGASHADAGPVQRIGMAVSSDLLTWRRTPVCIEADPRWYEKAGEVSTEEHWRDPWAIVTPDGAIHLLITARAAGGPPDERGVIGHAWSRDLVDWIVEPPVSKPGAYRQLEVSQVIEVEGRWHLLASLGPGDYAASRRAISGFSAVWGTITVSADAPLGPFRTEAARVLVGDTQGSMYAARVVRWRGSLKLLAWQQVGADGGFVGELTDPIDLRVDEAGELEVVRPASAPGAS